MRDWLISLLGGTPKREESSYQGHTAFVNVPPSDRATIARHLTRIQRCRDASEKTRDAARLRDLADEIHRRAVLLSLAGVQVPSGDLSTLIEEYN